MYLCVASTCCNFIGVSKDPQFLFSSEDKFPRTTSDLRFDQCKNKVAQTQSPQKQEKDNFSPKIQEYKTHLTYSSDQTKIIVWTKYKVALFWIRAWIGKQQEIN